MEFEKLCLDCKSVGRKSYLTKDGFKKINREIEQIENNLCSNCIILMHSFYEKEKTIDGLNTQRDLTNDSIFMPKNSYFYHSNRNVLSLNDPKNEQYKEKTVLFVCRAMYRFYLYKNIKSYSFKRTILLCNKKCMNVSKYFDDFIFADSENLAHKEDTQLKITEYVNERDIKVDAIITLDDGCAFVFSSKCIQFDEYSV
jgi:hypothetical protein